MIYDYKTIECGIENEYIVYGHGEYGPESVNEGMPRRDYLDSYETLQEAQQAHPSADTSECSTKREYHMPDCAPAWFDAAAAGESW